MWVFGTLLISCYSPVSAAGAEQRVLELERQLEAPQLHLQDAAVAASAEC
jgi:hypothetical protein